LQGQILGRDELNDLVDFALHTIDIRRQDPLDLLRILEEPADAAFGKREADLEAHARSYLASFSKLPECLV
jgi:hypothetical protein